MELSYLDAVILGIVEGLTEYLPVSSTGHLTITEKLLGLSIDNPTVTGYTATIQIGAIAATRLNWVPLAPPAHGMLTIPAPISAAAMRTGHRPT